MPYQPDLRCKLMESHGDIIKRLQLLMLDYDTVDVGYKTLYVCKVCRDSRPREPYNCKAHDATQVHKDAITTHEAVPPFADETRGKPTANAHVPTHDLLTEDGLRALLVSLTGQPNQPLYPPGHPVTYGEPNFTAHARSPSPATGINWALYETFEETSAERPFEVQLAEDIAQAMLSFLNGSDSEFGDDELSNMESSLDSSKSIFLKSDIDVIINSMFPGIDSDSSTENLADDSLPRKRTRANNTDPSSSREWYPWPDWIVRIPFYI